MYPVMQRSSTWGGLLFCGLIAAMFFYSAPKMLAFSDGQTDSVRLFLNGELTRTFERHYDRTIFFRKGSVTGWSTAAYTLFNEGLSGVVIGSNDWLYTNEEFVYPNNFANELSRRITKIEDTSKVLASHGKRLIIVPVPMKADIYAEHVAVDVSNAKKVYDSFLDEIKPLNIELLDTRSVLYEGKMKAPVFLKKDTHWTPEGARLVAAALAETFPNIVGNQQFTTESAGSISYEGDLLNFIKISKSVNSSIYEHEVFIQYETFRQLEEIGEAGLLADNPQLSMSVVGTSYTEMDEWNFKGFLRESLQSDFYEFAYEKKGPFFAMNAFLNSDLLSQTTVTTVVWEFPVRSLVVMTKSSSDLKSMVSRLF